MTTFLILLFIIPVLAIYSLNFIGMLIGGLVAAGTAAAEANRQKKAAAGGGGERPERRRMTKLQDMMNESFNRRQRALLAVAQSHLDYAKMF